MGILTVAVVTTPFSFEGEQRNQIAKKAIDNLRSKVDSLLIIKNDRLLKLIDEINKGKGLARDPYSTPVSCVIYYNGKPYGYGGAMGPAQFIPSTWSKLGYGQKVSAITGKAADPWDIRDAFLATGLLLRDNGAKTSEFNAAMKYYCGGSCTSYDKFYGNSVISIANQYEADIKAIGG